MRRILMALCFAGCLHAVSNPTQGSTTAIGPAFYCGANRQCFTAEADCATHGTCNKWDQAWCAVYNDDTGERLACGVERLDCQQVLSALHAVDHGECVVRHAIK